MPAKIEADGFSKLLPKQVVDTGAKNETISGANIDHAEIVSSTFDDKKLLDSLQTILLDLVISSTASVTEVGSICKRLIVSQLRQSPLLTC